MSSNGMSSRAGVVYVATKGDSFIEEAFFSADTVKQRYPGLPVTLFTDRVNHRLCATDRFDTVLPAVRVASGISMVGSEAKLKRALCLRRTPYPYTLYLDTDTEVVTDELMPLFSLLDDVDVAMVETIVDDSYSRVQFGRPMFNTGVILFRKSPLTLEWLASWAALSERNFRWSSKNPLPRVSSLRHVEDEDIRRRLMNFDQIAMAEILSPENNKFGLKFKVLDPSWNYRGSLLAEKEMEKPRILHFPREKTPGYAAELEAAIHRMELRMGQGRT